MSVEHDDIVHAARQKIPDNHFNNIIIMNNSNNPNAIKWFHGCMATVVFVVLIILPQVTSAVQETRIRVPAEWEPHAATWVQWPGAYEAAMRPVFAELVYIVDGYEPVHVLVNTEKEKQAAQQFFNAHNILAEGVMWHVVPLDNAWMRDNGPIYVTDGKRIWVQDWGFNAWGGNWGQRVSYENDDAIPKYVADQLGLRLENRQDYVLEKGNLEVNGAGLALINWDCQQDRNPGLERSEHEKILMEALGLRKIIWAYGHDPLDGTTGHIDGSARFVNATTIVVADTGQRTELDLAKACTRAGLEVIWYPGDPNWLVGNGFVVAMSSGHREDDAEAQMLLEELFPKRDVYLIDAGPIVEAGGGIHCVTNDQPRRR